MVDGLLVGCSLVDWLLFRCEFHGGEAAVAVLVIVMLAGLFTVLLVWLIGKAADG